MQGLYGEGSGVREGGEGVEGVLLSLYECARSVSLSVRLLEVICSVLV